MRGTEMQVPFGGVPVTGVGFRAGSLNEGGGLETFSSDSVFMPGEWILKFQSAVSI